MNKLIAMLVVALMVSAAMATVPNPAVRYRVADGGRDTCVIATGQSHVNCGARDHCRAAKGDANSGEMPLHDWDMVAVQAGINTELTMWGKTLAQAMALDMITVDHQIVNPFAGDWPGKLVHLRTVMSVNDWHEGDGFDWDTNYDWTTPYGATWTYAGDTVPFSAGAIEWLAPGGTPGANIEFRYLSFRNNSTSIFGMYATVDLDDPPDGIQADEVMWNSARLDEAFWQELIYEDNCVGVGQYGDGWWPGLDVNGDPVDPNRPLLDDNVTYAQQGQWTALVGGANLLIEVKPHDGDAQPDGFVDLLDLTIVANNWELNPGGNEWEQADFNSDGNVDLLDLTLLANEWEWAASGGAAAVPEPASLVVLCVGALALIRRRR